MEYIVELPNLLIITLAVIRYILLNKPIYIIYSVQC